MRTGTIYYVACALTLAISVGGCGNSTKPKGPPTATFTFRTGLLRPATLQLPATSTARLVVVSADGLAHAVDIDIGKQHQRLLTPPAGHSEVLLTGLQAGHSYRVVPDGATEPVVLRIG